MEMNFKASDMELLGKASAIMKYDEYIQTREEYRIRNPRKYVNANTHRKIMQESIDLAKTVINRGGTDDEVRNAVMYFYVCVDSRKYCLNYGKARKDFRIDELIRKYMKDIPDE